MDTRFSMKATIRALAALVFVSNLSAQLTVTYSDGEVNASAYNTSPPNDPLTLSVPVGSAEQTGQITGSGDVIKTGEGILGLSSPGTNYTGTTTIAEGTLVIANTIFFDSPIDITAAGQLVLDGSGAVVLHKGISGAGSVGVSGGPAGVAYLRGDNSGFTGTFTLPQGSGTVVWIHENGGSATARWDLSGAAASISTTTGDHTVKLGALSGSNPDTVLGGVADPGVPHTAIFEIGALDTDTTFAGRFVDNAFSVTALTKVGTGTLTLTGASDYAGLTMVNGGTLAFVAGGSLTRTGEIRVGTGGNTGTLAIADGVVSIRGDLTLGENGGSGTLTIGANGVAVVEEGAGLTVGGTDGTGTVNLQALGELWVGGVDGIQKSDAGAANFNWAGGTLHVGDSDLSTSVPMTLSEISILDTGSKNATLAGALTGPGGLIKTGDGAVTLTGVGDYAGPTVVRSGALVLADGGSLATQSLQVGSPSEAGAVTVSSDAGTATLFAREHIALGAENGGGSGTLAIGDGGVVTLGEGARLTVGQWAAGTVKLETGGTLNVGGVGGIVKGAGMATFEWSGGTLRVVNSDLTADVPMTLYGTSVFDTNGFDATLLDPLTGVGGFTKTGAGTLTLASPSSNYTGATTIAEGTVAILGNPSFNSPVAIAAQGELVLGGGDVRLHQGLGGEGNVTVAGKTTVRLRGDNGGFGGVFTAPTGARGVIWQSESAGSAAARWDLSGDLAVVDTGDGDQTVMLGALSGSNPNTILGGSNGTGVKTLQVGALNIDTVFAGRIVDQYDGGTQTVALTKVGTGTLTLTGASTYTGPTTVSAGRLVVNGSLASDVTVESGAVLAGTGTVGDITLTDGAQLQPGESIGALHGGTFTWDGGGVMVFELGADGVSDQLVLSGDFLKGTSGGFAYAFTFVDAGWEVGQTYDLVTFNAISFDPEDFSFTNADGFDGEFTLGDGKLQFTLLAVPEPSTVALISLACLVLLFQLRRRRWI